MRNVEELESNVKSAREPLPREMVEALSSATDRLKEKLGSSFDHYERVATDRTR